MWSVLTAPIEFVTLVFHGNVGQLQQQQQQLQGAPGAGVSCLGAPTEDTEVPR